MRTIHGIDLSDVRFKTRFLDDRYHLCFLHDALHERPEEERLEVAGTFLDHALGEHIVMEYVGHLEFRPAGAGIEVGLLVNEIVVETGDLEVIPAPAG